MTTVFYNGKFLGPDEARISAFDAGFQHGVGLFETMLGGTTALDETWVYRLDDHLERLAASARDVGLSEQLRTQGLYDAVMETTARAGYARARVRLTITGGDLNLLTRKTGEGDQGRGAEPTILIVAQPATEYPEAMMRQGVMVSIADARANPFNPFEGHKTLNYWWRLRELQAASSRGASEALVLQVSNHLCGGCVSNVFVVKDGMLRTPIVRGEEAGSEQPEDGGDPMAPAQPNQPTGPKGAALPSPVLPGITRRAIIELAEMRSIAIEKRMLSIEDLLEADEVFLTNSSWGVLPVAAIEAHAVGEGTPGEVTVALREALTRSITGEIE